MIYAHRILVSKPKGVDGKIILNYILVKYGVKGWNGFNRFSMGSNSSFVNTVGNFLI
jgi:hypothetical protein